MFVIMKRTAQSPNSKLPRGNTEIDAIKFYYLITVLYMYEINT